MLIQEKRGGVLMMTAQRVATAECTKCNKWMDASPSVKRRNLDVGKDRVEEGWIEGMDYTYPAASESIATPSGHLNLSLPLSSHSIFSQIRKCPSGNRTWIETGNWIYSRMCYTESSRESHVSGGWGERTWLTWELEGKDWMKCEERVGEEDGSSMNAILSSGLQQKKELSVSRNRLYLTHSMATNMINVDFH